MKHTLLALLMTAVGASAASAGTITVLANPGTTYNASGILDSELGSNLAGMLVTASWRTSTGPIVTATAAWAATGATSGGVLLFDNASSPDFTVGITGNTFPLLGGIWQLAFNIQGSTNRLISLEFQGAPGKTAFDRTCGGAECTPGSSLGADFAAVPLTSFSNPLLYAPAITATYTNQVVVNSNPFGGDLYTNLLIQFGNGTYSQGLPEVAVVAGNALPWTFVMDTDTLVTPEPASLLLLGSGVVALARRARNQRRTPKA